MSLKTEEAKIVEEFKEKYAASDHDSATQYLIQALVTHKASILAEYEKALEKVKSEAIKYPLQGVNKDRVDGYNAGYSQSTEDTLQALNKLKEQVES